MGADQQFCLRWNNFHTNITSAFESLRDDEDFVDITLACEGRQVKAHKMVLSACSPYFRSLLKGNPCQHPIVFLKDVTFANLASILDFMYHGEVNVSHNELATFLKTAEALKVRGLAEDDKRKDSDGYIDASSPGPPRDPPDPGSPRPDETSATDTHLSESPPPHKKRRRSGTSVQSAEDTNETVISEIRETSVKNEPQEFNDEDDILGHSVDTGGDIKTDNVGVSTSSVASGGNEDGEDRSNFGLSDSVTISRSQAAMQQLQESFGSFLPAMSQSSGFLSHGATDMPRPPFPLEGVQGLPPGISTLPGPSMSQAGASQDTSQGLNAYRKSSSSLSSSSSSAGTTNNNSTPRAPGSKRCPVCHKWLSRWSSMKRHFEDKHMERQDHICTICNNVYKTKNSLRNHTSVYHRKSDVSKVFQNRASVVENFNIPLQLTYEAFGGLEGLTQAAAVAQHIEAEDSLYSEDSQLSEQFSNLERLHASNSEKELSRSVDEQGGFEALLVTDTDLSAPSVAGSDPL